MSVDEDMNLAEKAMAQREGDSAIRRTSKAVLDDDTVIETNPIEIAKDASGLAWVAMWISVVAVVIAIGSAAISLS